MRLVLVLLGLAIAGFAWLWFRPNRAEVDPRLRLEHWDAVADGLHNSNTDMILWQGDFLLVHDARPYHFGSPEARLVLRRSTGSGPSAPAGLARGVALPRRGTLRAPGFRGRATARWSGGAVRGRWG